MADEVENEILDLFRAYMCAPAARRAEIYTVAERQVLKRLRAARENGG